jgi:hypothetical protein
MTETWVERLRRRVDEAGPHTPQEDLGAPILIWLGHLPLRVREAIFLLLEGYDRQTERSYNKAAETRRARRAK